MAPPPLFFFRVSSVSADPFPASGQVVVFLLDVATLFTRGIGNLRLFFQKKRGKRREGPSRGLFLIFPSFHFFLGFATFFFCPPYTREIFLFVRESFFFSSRTGLSNHLLFLFCARKWFLFFSCTSGSFGPPPFCTPCSPLAKEKGRVPPPLSFPAEVRWLGSVRPPLFLFFSPSED